MLLTDSATALPAPAGTLIATVIEPAELLRAGIVAALTGGDGPGRPTFRTASYETQDLAVAGEPDTVVDVLVVGPGAVGTRSRASATRPPGVPCPGVVRVLLVDLAKIDAAVQCSMVCSVLTGAPGAVLSVSTSAADLRSAVAAAASGQSQIQPGVGAALLAELAAVRQTQAVETTHLTGREHEVLGLLAEGMGNREIARRLVISENTVKNHIRNLLDKLHAHSRTEVVVHAVREHLIELDRASDPVRKRI